MKIYYFFIKAIYSFTMDIFKEIAQLNKGDNILISPVSISSLLKIFYNGASGDTKEQLYKYVKDNTDTSKATGFVTESRLYARSSIDFKDDFMDKMEDKIVKVDFFNNSKEIKDDINQWVNKLTNGNINPLLINQLSINTKMIGINVSYFKGEWLHPFNKSDTFIDNFYISKTDTVPISMMYINDVFRYSYEEQKFGSFYIIDIPYIGNTSMVVILPYEIDGLSSIENNLTIDNFNKWCDKLENHDLELYMPKFKSIESYDMIDIFTRMGLNDIFYNGDFSNMTDSPIYINDIVHKTYIDVNEDYTESAAATYSLITDCATMPKKIRINHPFIYIIKQTNGNIMFMGRFCSPKK
ncbi:SPI-2/CrmA inhibits Fas-mediated apoptosis, IL-1 convertase, lipoxygenase pathway [Yokapox virus]|uniref:SPI-2/CrmA inhibits Fas-mediated apoptosis, IL-1 convertase, lipoxygenase pathway n=1 Tax=Yokapox virus TaxID=1076255 RepID=G3EI57_9POXV|nr:SPI-2/CrmA inhibits Fas-mediated apoptosis, IL-1 convertase, lipoxygenase pathway [Yokapox virus]AEN03754.1 SPI-2/CrmA inhibits Fas-mediated apoptosis, IL-1 convertase, lipoxygenase pathway [Yokapox virus]